MINRDLKPGKFLMRESVWRDGFVRSYGIVTKVAKSRIYYQDDGHESFCNDFKLVCDTEAERDALIAFDKKARDDLHRYKQAQKAEFEALVARHSNAETGSEQQSAQNEVQAG